MVHSGETLSRPPSGADARFGASAARDAGWEARAGRVLSFPIMAVNVKDSLARIAPSETTIGPPSTTARHLVNASLSDNTRRAYAGALG